MKLYRGAIAKNLKLVKLVSLIEGRGGFQPPNIFHNANYVVPKLFGRFIGFWQPLFDCPLSSKDNVTYHYYS